MAFGLIQIEQERSDLWKAEVEAGFPICKRKMVHGATFEDVMAKVAETYREMVPVPKPKADAVEITGHRERLSAIRYLADGGTPSLGTAAEPADAHEILDASEAGEIETGDLAGSAEAGQVAMSDYVARQDDKIVASLSAAPAEAAVRQKRQYRKRGTAAS